MKTKIAVPFCGRSGSISLGISLLALAISLALTSPAQAQSGLVKISVDNLSNTDSVHKTEVEPDTFAWGNTIVSAFHMWRGDRDRLAGEAAMWVSQLRPTVE
jgi:hypothetical protein